MDDVTNPETEVTTPEPQPTQPEPEAPGAELDGDAEDEGLLEADAEEADAEGDEGDLEDGQDDDQPSADFVEIEFEGETHKVPEKLKDAFMKNADYTQKTQELADKRRAADQTFDMAKQNLELNQKFFDDAAEMRNIDRQLEQFNQIDWQTLSYDDPNEFTRLQWQRQQLVEQRQTASQRMEQIQAQAVQQQQLHQAQLREEGTKELKKAIPNWGKEEAAKVMNFGKSLGFGDHELANLYDPRQVRLLHRLMTLENQVAKAGKSAKRNVKDAEPVSKVKGRNQRAKGKDPRKMSTDEWMRYRNKQVAAGKKR